MWLQCSLFWGAHCAAFSTREPFGMVVRCLAASGLDGRARGGEMRCTAVTIALLPFAVAVRQGTCLALVCLLFASILCK